MAGVARQSHMQVVHYLRKRVNYNDAGISSGVVMGTLPAGAQVIDLTVRVLTAFNATSTNVLTVGTNSSSWDNLTGSGSSDVTEGTPEMYRVAPSNFDVTFSADTDVYVKYAQTGTAAGTGQADIILTYVPNADA